MIPEITLYTVIYTIVGLLVGGGSIVIVKIYYPEYDYFKIEYVYPKGLEDKSTKPLSRQERRAILIQRINFLRLPDQEILNFKRSTLYWSKTLKAHFDFSKYDNNIKYSRYINYYNTKVHVKPRTALTLYTATPGTFSACVVSALLAFATDVLIVALLLKLRRKCENNLTEKNQHTSSRRNNNDKTTQSKKIEKKRIGSDKKAKAINDFGKRRISSAKKVKENGTEMAKRGSSSRSKKEKDLVMEKKSDKINTIVLPFDSFPLWGGNGGQIKFINTCPIDGWIVIFHCLCLKNKLVQDRISWPDGKELLDIENLCIKEQFNEIKSMLMRMNSICVQDNTATFLGNEFNLFISHFKILYKSYQVSQCSSWKCPHQLHLVESSTPICWMDARVPLVEVIESYILETGPTSSCRQMMKREKNDRGAGTSLYCSGTRTIEQRYFFGNSPVPIVIPVDVELMLALSGQPLSPKDVPTRMVILGETYSLRAFTLYSEAQTHYTCVFRFNGIWFYFDDLSKDNTPILFTGQEIPPTYNMNYLLFEKL